MYSVETVIVGAGVIGLAIARALAQGGREVVVLEAENVIGTGISSRNSEVIHSGIYYEPGSKKALLCSRGRELLYEFCAHNEIPHQLCGKLIVATSSEQEQALERIRSKALANRVELELLDRATAIRLEPQLHCTAALLARQTGILDAHAFMLALQGQAERAGASIAFGTRMTRARVIQGSIHVYLDADQEPALQTQWLVNCGGLHAIRIAKSIEGLPPESIPAAHFAKGNYFALRGKSPFARLIYPIPEPGGLGTHLTLDLAGQARFGPDVEWLASPAESNAQPMHFNFDVDPSRSAKFYSAIRKYWPGLPDESLVPAYSGIRPKISGPTEAAADFRIDGLAHHGVRGVINLFGIESPGLTSSLAIADEVALQVE